MLSQSLVFTQSLLHRKIHCRSAPTGKFYRLIDVSIKCHYICFCFCLISAFVPYSFCVNLVLFDGTAMRTTSLLSSAYHLHFYGRAVPLIGPTSRRCIQCKGKKKNSGTKPYLMRPNLEIFLLYSTAYSYYPPPVYQCWYFLAFSFDSMNYQPSSSHSPTCHTSDTPWKAPYKQFMVMTDQIWTVTSRFATTKRLANF